MDVYLKLQSPSQPILSAWYNVDHKLSFRLSSE
ncbi:MULTISPECIES: tryptophanase leader peptide [Photobacterium]|uniref:Tryptophanase leader peptide n=1 Tax=Photobacterium alginatilyticum TaxID=1775171 RepID=A0ABW9YJE1_9GAMM|nr:tryptophanase leader peptide [Photobacterium alginatilyticum]